MTITRRAARLAVLIATPLAAHGFSAGDLKIGHPWSRETAPGQAVGAGFMSIANTGKQDDRLLSARSPAAREVQVHSMTMDGGVMRMRQLTDGLAVRAGTTVALKPGSYHLMLIGLKAPLKQGAMVPAELTFKRAGKVRVTFKVEAVSYAGAEGSDHARH